MLKKTSATTTPNFSAGKGNAWAGLVTGEYSGIQLVRSLYNRDNSTLSSAAPFVDCKYGATVAEIEADEIYRQIMTVTQADAATNIKFIGCQDSLVKGATYDVRFIAGIQDLNYAAVGFKVTIEKADGAHWYGCAPARH